MLEIMLNDISKFSTGLYLRHVHGGAVADLFLGDDLFGVDRFLPLAQRVEAAKKRVAKEKAQSALSSATKGQSKGGGGGGAGKGGKGRGRGQQQFQGQQQQFPQQQMRGYNPNQGGGRGAAYVGGGGAAGGAQPPVCYGCGAAGHIQRNCPNRT